MKAPFNKARWIIAHDFVKDGLPRCPADTAPVFRKIFQWNGEGDMTLYITGVGFYDLRINGQTVTDELLNPAFTHYLKTVYYQTIPVTECLVKGENTIEVTVGNGWYYEQQPSAWRFEQAVWKQCPRMICVLMQDGEPLIVSDSSWEWAESATVFNSLRSGETCDGRITPVFSRKALVVTGPSGELKPQTIQPIRLRRVIQPVQINRIGNDMVYDFGIITAGNAEIRVSGPCGAKVTMLYSEKLYKDGRVDQSSIKKHVHTERFQQDEYILKGDGEETWHSLFGYHGFRYVQVTADEGVELLSVTARQFHTDLPTVGGFTADDESITRIQNSLLNSTLTNFHHIPTDCPQREKNGWTGDAHLSCRQALYNFDMRLAYTKWLDDIVDCQRRDGHFPCIVPSGELYGYHWANGITWDAALILLPWEMYQADGDDSPLRRYAEPIKTYLGFLEGELDNGIPVMGLGDWLPPPNAEVISPEALRTLMAILCTRLCVRMGKIIGDDDLCRSAEEIETVCTAAFHRKYDGMAGQTPVQLYYALRLLLNLTPDREQELQWLKDSLAKADNHVMGGIFTARYVPEALLQAEQLDLLWTVMSAKGYPGWDDMTQHGSTTMTECWHGGGSLNHHMFSCIGAWYYEAIAGIRRLAPGYAQVLISPYIPEGLNAFSAWHDTPHGRLAVDYANGALTVTVPQGISAALNWQGRETVLNAGTQVVWKE